MEEKLLRGKPVADALTDDIIDKVGKLNDQGIFPKLAMLKVGNRADDASYQKGATNRCAKCGVETMVVELAEDCSQEDYLAALEDLNKDETVHGILCFRPLPAHIDEEIVKYYIDDKKDVDCFSPLSLAKIMSGDKRGFAPCTPMGVIEILKYYDIDLRGKNVTVLGRSMVVAKPLSMLRLNRDSTVTICHSKSKDLENIVKESDILVSCMGRAKAVDKSYIKEGAVVIDVGINFDQEGKMCGDVDTDDVIERVSHITPVPGGVGSVTSSILARHTLRACIQLHNL